MYSCNCEVRRLKWKITLPPKHATWRCDRSSQNQKMADKADLHSGFYVRYKSQGGFLLSLTSVGQNGPSTHFWTITTSWKTHIMSGIVLNADYIVPLLRLRPHLIFTTASLLGVTRGQGQVPRVQLESRLKCSEKPHTAARNEKNNNVDMAFPLWQ